MMQPTMTQALSQSTSHRNMRVVRMEPDVKSAKTRKLFNAGVRASAQKEKSTDPTCYNSSRSRFGTGLFENVEMKMERTIALKKLGRLLGKKLGYRVDAKAPTKEERDAASAELMASNADFDKLKERREARYQAVLAADPEYQTLKAACAEARERREKLSRLTRHYKITVGTSEGMFFMVKAQGDTWEDILGKLTEKQAA